jgi:hypothetical protein
VVDLLVRHHYAGRRFEPTAFVEEGSRVAVSIKVGHAGPGGESVRVYKVFTFREADGEAVLLQDCVDREDALARLRSG